MKEIQAVLQEEAGSELVEFALSISVLLMVIFGIMDFSRAVYIDHFLANAAREASRYAMVRGSSWKGAVCSTTTSFGCTANNTDVAAYARSTTPAAVDPASLIVSTTWSGMDASGVSCTTSGLPANSPGCVVSVKLTYAFSFVLPFLPEHALVLTSTSKVTIAQ